MKKVTVWLSGSLLVEKVGDEVLVLPAGSVDTFRLTGEAANIVNALDRNGRLSLAESGVLAELLAAGIIETEQPSGLSRRSLLKTGAIGVGAGIATLALPTAAYAASVTFVETTGVWFLSSKFEISTSDGGMTPAMVSAFNNGILPSDLTIVSHPGAASGDIVPLLVASGVPSSNHVRWDDDSIDGSVTDDAVGTFSWDGVSYRVTFTYFDD